MKLARTLSFAGLGATSLAALLVAQGCSSSTTPATVTDNDAGHVTPTPDSGGTGKAETGSAPAAVGTPPSPSGAKTTSTTKHNFAIRNLYLGDTTPTSEFKTSATAWESFGYNIDGLVTTAASTDVCSPHTKGVTKQQIDGPNGVDNAFGAAIVSAISSEVSSSTVSGSIQGGKFTLEVDTVGLDGTATQTAQGLSGQLFAGSTYGGTPTVTNDSFAITDNWPVNGSLLVDPTDPTQGSKITFPDAYVTNGTWVSGVQNGASIQLSIAIAGATLNLTIHDGVITMPVSSASGQLHAKTAIVSGVLETQELLTGLNVIFGALNECSFASLAAPLVLGAQDIIISADGSTVSNKAGTPCNAISIGLAFDADEIAQPSTVATPGTPVDGGGPCTASN